MMSTEQVTAIPSEEWAARVKKAVAAGDGVGAFMRTYGINNYHWYNVIKPTLSDEPHFQFKSKGALSGDEHPMRKMALAKTKQPRLFDKPTRAKAEPVYTPMIIQEEKPTQADIKPLSVAMINQNCLMLTFASKEETLQAMGRYM